jgi:hypothetical protein
MANIETFNVDEDFMQDFDYDIIDDLAMKVVEDTWPMFGSILTPSTPSTFESITTLANNLDSEANDTWEVLKIYLPGIKSFGSINTCCFSLGMFYC